MLTLINNELRKIVFKKKTLVVFIGFMALVGFICFGMYKDSEAQKRQNTPEFKAQMLQSNINQLEQDKSNPNFSEADKKNIDTQIASMEEELLSIKQNKDVKQDWRSQYQKDITDIKNINSQPGISEGQKANGQIQINEKQYALDHNITPDNQYDFTAFKYIDFLIMLLGTIFMIIGVLVFAADMVSGEYTPPTMKLLLTQPVSRAKVLFSKYIAAVISALVLILSVELISFLIIGLIFGFGNAASPVSIGTKYKLGTLNSELIPISGTTHIVATWQYTLMNIGMQALYIIAAISFAFLVSTILTSSMISMVVGVVVSIVLIALQGLSFISKIAPYIFIYQGDTSSLLKGQLAQRFMNTHINLQSSIIIMLSWIIICYLVSHIVFIKKDILI